MKAFAAIMVAMLLFFSVPAKSTVQFEQQQANGNIYTRLVNFTRYPRSCYFKDQHRLYTFVVYPNSRSQWYILQGNWTWGCQ